MVNVSPVAWLRMSRFFFILIFDSAPSERVAVHSSLNSHGDPGCWRLFSGTVGCASSGTFGNRPA
jgi:hypothetical protein